MKIKMKKSDYALAIVLPFIVTAAYLFDRPDDSTKTRDAEMAEKGFVRVSARQISRIGLQGVIADVGVPGSDIQPEYVGDLRNCLKDAQQKALKTQAVYNLPFGKKFFLSYEVTGECWDPRVKTVLYIYSAENGPYYIKRSLLAAATGPAPAP